MTGHGPIVVDVFAGWNGRLRPQPDFTQESATGDGFEPDGPTLPAGEAGRQTETVQQKLHFASEPFRRRRQRQQRRTAVADVDHGVGVEQRGQESPLALVAGGANAVWDRIDGRPVDRIAVSSERRLGEIALAGEELADEPIGRLDRAVIDDIAREVGR